MHRPLLFLSLSPTSALLSHFKVKECEAAGRNHGIPEVNGVSLLIHRNTRPSLHLCTQSECKLQMGSDSEEMDTIPTDFSFHVKHKVGAQLGETDLEFLTIENTLFSNTLFSHYLNVLSPL